LRAQYEQHNNTHDLLLHCITATLEQVFDCCTEHKARCRRDWRLLILNGHNSHLSKEFIDYCNSHVYS
jgi:hypothetical protein